MTDGRDDFTSATRRILAERAGHRCSKPGCGKPTSGPDGGSGTASIGVAAHITAASEGGPRFSDELSNEQRRDSSNGIWLCQTCSRIIDSDELGHPIELLFEWKAIRELSAALELRGFEVRPSRGFINLERKMPELFDEVRSNLQSEPFVREFVLMSKGTRLNGSEMKRFTYYHEDHSDLLEKCLVMENYGAVLDVRTGNVPIFRFSEELVDYLMPMAL
ncbi:MAG: hypothetical protein ABNH38_09935 [Tateyamaria sp.]|jgi:hypothetical protein|uniref:hypothetical protein n=1 Tax=Tateyamaria sp. TaxID=1929288 RepID=UPI0032DDBB0F